MVSATEVDVWLFTAACQKPRPGIEAMFCHQYVIRLKIIAATRVVISSQVMLVIDLHTAEYAASFGMANAKMPTTRISETTTWTARQSLFRRAFIRSGRSVTGRIVPSPDGPVHAEDRPGSRRIGGRTSWLRADHPTAVRVVGAISPRDAAGWSALRRAGGDGAGDAPRRGPTRAGSRP